MASSGKRRPREELRSLLLEAGAEVVRAKGAGIGAANVTYKAVFEHLFATQGITVTRGSVHERIWNSQHEFQLDVVRHVAATERLDDFSVAIDRATDAISVPDGDAALDRETALRTALRIGSAAFLDAPEGDQWQSWIGAVSFFAVGDEDAAEAARGSVAAHYDDTRAEIIAPLRAFLVDLGLRPRTDLFGHDLAGAEAQAYPLVATMLHTYSEGANLRRGLDSFPLDEIVLSSARDGSDERWDSVGLQALALVTAFFEPSN